MEANQFARTCKLDMVYRCLTFYIGKLEILRREQHCEMVYLLNTSKSQGAILARTGTGHR